jgi:hypothetical protein
VDSNSTYSTNSLSNIEEGFYWTSYRNVLVVGTIKQPKNLEWWEALIAVRKVEVANNSLNWHTG